MTTRLPLTFQQQWLLDRMRESPDWSCIAAYAFRLRGVLNVDLLERSIEGVMRRHVSLRSHLVLDRGVARQAILDPWVYNLQTRSIAGTSAAMVEAEARRVVEADRDFGIEPETGALWSAKLLELSEQEHWLVLAMHRLIGDCACIDQVYREVQILYAALVRGSPPTLIAATQYSDYALGQHQGRDEWHRRHQDHWRNCVPGMHPLQWPAQPALGLAGPGAVGKMDCRFGEALSAEFRDFGRQARTLAATAMMALYVAVLWRWCGQSEFVLPFNIAGRQPGHKATIGFFSYLLHLRVRIDGTETFRELLDRIGNDFFTALCHQDFGRVAIEHPELICGTVFQWMTWHADDAGEASGSMKSGLPEAAMDRVAVREFGEGLTVVPPGVTAVEVTFFDTTTGIRAFATYRADRFAAATMERFLLNLRTAMELFVRNPHERIAVLSASGGQVDEFARNQTPSDKSTFQCDSHAVSAG